MEQEIGKERYTPMGQEAESETYQVDMEKIYRQLDAEDKVIEYLAGEIAKERKKPGFLQDQARIDKCIDTIAKLKNHKTEYSQEELKAKADALLAKARAKEAAETAAAPARRYRLRPVLVAVIVLVVVCLCGVTACGVIPSLKNWFLKLIDMPAGASINEEKITYVYNGKLTEYSGIEELIEAEKIAIRCPTDLPYEISVTGIKKFHDEGAETYIFMFSEPQIKYIVVANYQDTIRVDDSHKMYCIGDIDVFYWYNESSKCYVARFIDNDNYCTLSVPNEDLLINILDSILEK